MDAFSFLSVLLSIILGLAITQVLKGFRGILLGRRRVRMYWPVPAWAFLLLLMFVQSWWAMFDLREVAVWTFPAFSIVLLQTILSYMLAALVFPDFVGNETVDLRAHYFEHARWFFGLTVGVLLASLSKDLVLSGHFGDPLNVAFHLAFGAIALAAMATRAEWYHRAMPIVAIVVFVAYTLVLFSRLR
jgi:hypothetical protein